MSRDMFIYLDASNLWVCRVVIHIGVGVCVARFGRMGNAKAFDTWDERQVQIPRLFLFICFVLIYCLNRPVRESAGNFLMQGVAMEILLFNTRDELLRVNLKYVVYFEADDNYTHIFFSNGVKATVLYTLSNMGHLIDEKLDGKIQPFIRVGKRYIVNSLCIFQINTLKRRLLLTSFESPQLFTLSVSKEALKSLKEVLASKHQ